MSTPWDSQFIFPGDLSYIDMLDLLFNFALLLKLVHVLCLLMERIHVFILFKERHIVYTLILALPLQSAKLFALCSFQI